MSFINTSPLNIPPNSGNAIRIYKINRAPTTSDFRNFRVSDEWWDTSAEDFYKLVYRDNTRGLWRRMTNSESTETFLPDSGTTPVEPDVNNQVGVKGGVGCETVGGTNEWTTNVTQATESELGGAEIATEDETKDGISDQSIVTPQKLVAYNNDKDLTGFVDWTGSGNYFDDTTLGTFTLLRGGSGYIRGKRITWAGSQSITGITAGNVYYIYIDSSGTIGSVTSRTDALYIDNIVLFQCFRDSTTPTNIQVTAKENHPYTFPVTTSNYLHNSINSVIEGTGANITLNGTQKIEISGADVLNDHGLQTTIADSGGVAVTWYQTYTNASNDWALYAMSDTFTGFYNNAGTPTALSAGKFGVYTLYAGKDNLNVTTPRYAAVLNTAEYDTLTLAREAILDGSIAMATTTLQEMEVCQLGYIIYSQATTSIVDVIIEKTSIGSNNDDTDISSLIINVTGRVVQTVTASTSALGTFTGIIPLDDTIPQNTEGSEIITATITPTNSSNSLLVISSIFFISAASSSYTIALFQDSTVNSLGATANTLTNTFAESFTSHFLITAGTTSATTLKIRAGSQAGGTFHINGFGAGRFYGGVANTRLTIMEIKP